MRTSLKKIKLVISDLHLAAGQEPGTYNPWESFYYDDKFCEFLEYYSSGAYGEGCEVELIINGDFIDFLQIRYQGHFPTTVTPTMSLEKLKICIAAHPRVWKALNEFIRNPGKTLTVLPGNHDIDLVLPEVRQAFLEAVGYELSHKVRFVPESEYFFDGILVQHGHQYETMHTFELDNLLLPGKFREPVLNLPFGSHYLLKVLYPLKERRSYIDQVRPLKYYFAWAFIFDIFFAIKFFCQSLFCFIWFHRPWKRAKEAVHVMRELLFAFPSLESSVRKALEKKPEVKMIICGHSHLHKIRKFSGGRLYFNCGTWTDVINLEIDNLGRYHQMTYNLIEYDAQGKPKVFLMEWKGFYNPMTEVYF